MAHLPVGRVIRVYQSADGHVRSAEIQVKDKVYTRPVARLITLPMIPETEENERGPPASTISVSLLLEQIALNLGAAVQK